MWLIKIIRHTCSWSDKLIVSTTFLNLCELWRSLLVEGFFYNHCPFFDKAFAQLGVITRTRKKFVEIVAVVEHYLRIIHAKNKKSKKQPLQISLPAKLADGRMPVKKGTVFISQHLFQSSIITSGLWLIRENLKGTVFIWGKPL